MLNTYAINLVERTDRFVHINKEFQDKSEFTFEVARVLRHTNGAIGLWYNIVNLVQEAKKNSIDFIIICEDDHQFTSNYNTDVFLKALKQAKNYHADILLGGVSWFKSGLQVSSQLFWVDKFTGLQFAVIFHDFFDVILKSEIRQDDVADIKISGLSNRKFIMQPFISTQKEFGYSDVTKKNNVQGYIKNLFKTSSTILNSLVKVREFYGKIQNIQAEFNFEEIVLPTYIINLVQRKERLEHIKAQFANRNEFDINIVEACKHPIGAIGLWQSVIKVIKLAIENEDDVIIICEDDHEFTKDYNRNFLIKNIIEANEQAADILSGGAGSFGEAVPITNERFWINPMFSTQFIVVYAKFFQAILDYTFKDTDTTDGVLSVLTSHKMLLCPFISTQKDFGYSDITWIHNQQKGLVSKMFEESSERLKKIRAAYNQYQY